MSASFAWPAFNPALDLELVRKVPLTPAECFDGWTNPVTLKQWFCPRPWQVVECEIDLRPGGIFANTMQGPDGQSIPRGEGCWLLVEAPHRLVWSNCMRPGYRPQDVPEPGFAFVCALEFETLPAGGTRYKARVMHANEAGKARHEAMGFEAGWSAALQQLVDLKRARN